MNSATLATKLRAWLPRLASLRITVVCLLLLFILTAWGTIYQAGNGLYAAQTRFFHSWFFLIGGIIPFPGAQLVIWVLFINLLASLIFRVKYSWGNLGNIITHAGILFLIAGSFVTYKYAVESYLPLSEGELSNVSLDRRNWELAVWHESGDAMAKKVSTLEMSPDQMGREIDFSSLGFKAVVENYYRNCVPETDPANSSAVRLMPRRPAKEPEDNVAGMVLKVEPRDGPAREFVLYGDQTEPVTVGGDLEVSLRHQRHPLPMTLKLLTVRREDYAGTNIARSFRSTVEVKSRGVNFTTRIYMNHPLHYQGFVFYQASYSRDAEGEGASVFQVVKNTGRPLPYISGGLIFSGMLIHFLCMLFGFGRRGEPGGRPKTAMARGRVA